MNIKKLNLPIIIIAVGMIVATVFCFLVGILKEPVVKAHDFEYSVTYSVDGEVKTHKGSYLCSFIGHDVHDDPTVRLYDGVHNIDGNVSESSWFTVARKDGVKLSLIINLNAAYLMGDPDKYEYESENEDPYLEAVDSDGYGVQVSDFFDAEIISWEYPEPIENSFKFDGFSVLYAVSMVSMLFAAVLTIIACVIFVKKDNGITYNLLDTLSTALNFVICFAVIPFITVAVFMFPLTIDNKSLIYQMYLCVPALTAFTVAASVALRRKGFAKSGLIVQLVFPALFFVQIFVESFINNVFS